MKFALLFLVMLAIPFAARAQLTLVSVAGGTETPVTGSYNFGNVGNTGSATAQFLVVNSAAVAVTINTISVSGEGFTIAAINGTLPYTDTSVVPLGFSVAFSGSGVALPGTYSASLLITTAAGTSISVILVATVVLGPTLTVLAPCSLTGSTIGFGTIVNGSNHLCNLLVGNQGAQPLNISLISVTGAFQGMNLPSTPLTLPAGGGTGTSLTVAIAPGCGSGALAGTLTLVSGSTTFTYPITASGADPPLPRRSRSIRKRSRARSSIRSPCRSNRPRFARRAGRFKWCFAPLPGFR
jgi:hypothetical protein